MGFLNRVKNLAIKRWYLIVIILIFILAFWLRSFPARFGELQALDPFYFFRLSEYALQNNFQLPNPDILRNAPFGTNPYADRLVPLYMPMIAFLMISFTGMQFLHFAIIWPAFLGAVAVFMMFFLGRELFNTKAGLFAAFFLAVLPAFITRTSAGFFEKEPIAGVFLMLVMYFFVKSYKKSSWMYGIFAGVSMFLLFESWGGSQFFVAFISAFVLIILLANRYSFSLVKAFAPVPIIGVGLTQLLPFKISFLSLSSILPFTILVILLIRFFAEKKSLIKKEYFPYITPGLLVIGGVAFLIGTFFSDFLNTLMGSFIRIVTLTPGVALSTVAESQPGNLGVIMSLTSAQLASSWTSSINFWMAITMAFLVLILAYIRITHEKVKYSQGILFLILIPVTGLLTFWFASWIFIPILTVLVFTFLGILLILYKIVSKRNLLMILPLIWFIGSVYGVLNFIRLSFLVGPPMALIAGYFLATLIDKGLSLGKIRNAVNLKQKLNYISLILIAIAMLTLTINVANAYAYSIRLGPSICSPREGQSCINFDENGNMVYDQSQPWYQAMAFMATQTPVESNILSWWDFGYWFQARGLRGSVSDGGYGFRFEIAQWYTAPVDEWDSFEWLKERGVSHILMDFTLPGKYGAISTIATQGASPVGILSFSPAGTLEQDGKTVLQFANGPFRLWIPQEGGALTGTPMLLQEQGGVFTQPNFINDICTTNGIIQAGNRTPSLGGCVSLSNFGVHYIPPQAENNIFTSLMFMEGAGLPVQKVFDNQLIKIYEVLY